MHNWHLCRQDEFQNVTISQKVSTTSLPFFLDTFDERLTKTPPFHCLPSSLERNTILGRCLTWINVFTIWCRCARMFVRGAPTKNPKRDRDSASEARGGRWRQKRSTFFEKRRGEEVAGGERVSLGTTKKSDIVSPISLIRRNCL